MTTFHNFLKSIWPAAFTLNVAARPVRPNWYAIVTATGLDKWAYTNADGKILITIAQAGSCWEVYEGPLGMFHSFVDLERAMIYAEGIASAPKYESWTK